MYAPFPLESRRLERPDHVYRWGTTSVSSPFRSVPSTTQCTLVSAKEGNFLFPNYRPPSIAPYLLIVLMGIDEMVCAHLFKIRICVGTICTR